MSDEDLLSTVCLAMEQINGCLKTEYSSIQCLGCLFFYWKFTDSGTLLPSLNTEVEAQFIRESREYFVLNIRQLIYFSNI